MYGYTHAEALNVDLKGFIGGSEMTLLRAQLTAPRN